MLEIREDILNKPENYYNETSKSWT